MTRYGFAKVLKSNESGWSGNKPNQRGKFIIVPKSFYSIFPELSRLILNDQKTIKCITLDKKVIGLNIVYHNAKFFPETHNRDHDEVRIYRNSDIDDALELEKDKLVVFLPISKNNDYTYCVFCLCERVTHLAHDAFYFVPYS